jgi:hypothetical protein
MKGELLILFVILLLALILCSFLGGNCGKEGMENGQTYYGSNGASAQLQTDSTGNNSLVVTTSDGTSTTYLNTNSDMYTGPNGATATVKQGTNGTAVQVKDSSGNIVLTLTSNSNNGNSTATTQNGTFANTSTNSSGTSGTSSTTTNYDNYNHYNGSSYPTTFYGPDGGTARVIKTDNNNTLVITNKNGTTDIYYIDSNGSTASTYTGKNGGSAKMITDSNGNQAVEITGPNGSKLVYTGDNAYTYNSQDDTINQYDSNNNTTGTDVNETTYYGPNGGQATTVTGPGGNTYSSYDSSAYYNSLPQGVSRSQILPGEEDLYILKSQVIMPICPVCPSPIVKCPDSTDVNKCPPCPSCMRCSEPQFSCKKVPNYGAVNQDFMPVPVLSDFSSFGM